VTRTFAFECYADQDVVLFLRDDRGLPIRRFHASGQGGVINALLEKRKADLGMVDEDPLSSHHRLRDQMRVVSTTNDLELREQNGRYLIIVKPDLEECFRRCVARLDLESGLPKRSEELRTLLGIEGTRPHKVFRQELNTLYRESQRQRIQTFVTELEGILRSLPDS